MIGLISLLAVDADGVHIGQEDMPLNHRQKYAWGRDRIIGVSVFTIEEARAAEAGGADYLGLSPIFVTSTKPELNQTDWDRGYRAYQAGGKNSDGRYRRHERYQRL